MTYYQLAYWHLATVVPAFMLGSIILFRRKGTPSHKLLGKIYMLLMLVTAMISMFMPAHVGPKWLNHFGYIHILSLSVFYTVPTAYFAARRGDIKKHAQSMVFLYLGALLIAGGLAFMPGRLLHSWLFA